jgi:hypothetical protein
VEPEKKAEKKETFKKPATQVQRERRRTIAWAVALVVLVAIRVATLEGAPAVVPIGGVQGLDKASVPEGARKGKAPAVIVATAAWAANPADYPKIKNALAPLGVKSFRIVGGDGVLYATGRTGANEPVTVVRLPPKK